MEGNICAVSSADLDYQGQKLKVNIEQINNLRKLTDGEYDPLFIVNIEEQPNIQMTVQRLPLDMRGNHHLTCYADLATIESLNFKNCPYIIGYYGAMLDKDSLQLCFCTESMDASMENFYKTLHSLDNLTNILEWKHILCRLINNIASALNFLTINGISYQLLKPSKILVNRQALFKLCDVGVILLKTNKQEQSQNYTEILEIPCIKDVTEKADFIARIIDNIPLESD